MSGPCRDSVEAAVNWEVVADNIAPEVGQSIRIIRCNNPRYLRRIGIVRGIHYYPTYSVPEAVLTVRLDNIAASEGLINIQLFSPFNWGDFIEILSGA